MKESQVIASLLRRQGDLSLSAFARQIGVSQTYLWQIVNGDVPPGGKVLKFLGLRKVKNVTYEKL